MTQATEEIGPDLDEAIPETFDVCGDCGTPTVQLSSHSCPDPSTVNSPTREDLNQRIDQDPFPDTETVLVRKTRRTTTYAYHELDGDDNPLCPVNHEDEDAFEHLPRTDAQEQRYAPCQFCQRIRQANQEVAQQ